MNMTRKLLTLVVVFAPLIVALPASAAAPDAEDKLAQTAGPDGVSMLAKKQKKCKAGYVKKATGKRGVKKCVKKPKPKRKPATTVPKVTSPAPPTPDPPPPAPDPPGQYDKTFPERFVGETSATHTRTRIVTGTEDGLTQSTTVTETLTATVVFTREAVTGGYQYVSSGEELEWEVTGSSSNVWAANETCTADGGRVITIGPRNTGRYASGSIVRTAGPSSQLGPGGQYYLTGSYDFFGLGNGNRNRETYTWSCERPGVSYEKDSDYYPTAWLPTDTYFCDPTPSQPPRQFTIGLDGAMSGQDQCTGNTTQKLLSGATATEDYESSWSWSLAPAGP